jgi:O-antigen/teichoic acid export membrane protein
MYAFFERVIVRRLNSSAAMNAIAAMAIKGGGALLTLAVFTVAARAMSADQFGRLAIWFNVVGFLGIAAVFGQDTLIARSFGEYVGKKQYGKAWSAYLFGWILTIASCVAFVSAMLILGPIVIEDVSRSALVAAAFCLFTQALLNYASHSTQLIVNFYVSEITRDVLWRLLLLLVVAWSVVEQSLTVERFFFTAGVGQIVSLFVGFHFVCRTGSYIAEAVSLDDCRQWFLRGLPMWQSAILEAANLYVDVILIGYLTSADEAGQYFAAARIANMFLMVSGSLNTYTFSQSAKLYFSGESGKLQSILRTSVSICAVLLTPLWLVIYVFGTTLLSIFGSSYASAFPTLVVLATGCYLMSASGWASVVLLTIGQERIYSRVLTIATVVRILLTTLLAWRFGALGAAVGWAAVNVPLFWTLSFICNQRAGVDTSILSVVAPVRECLRGALKGNVMNQWR